MSDYISHHGVKGMKWGVRRAQKKSDKLARRIGKLSDKRDEVLDTRGIASKKNREMSKQLNLLKAKKALQDAKAKGNESDVMRADLNLKIAKDVKKRGFMDYDTRSVQKMFGNAKHKVDSKLALDMEALESLDRQKSEMNKARAKHIASQIGGLTLSSAVVYGYYQVGKKYMRF